ncbi:hypothetical protein GE061_004791 [Apolygus lucorum]|uniref:Uncharacterized protein n=1 Tax=Apolygus lucorum TaxID=248454 RepID=A0A6A4J5V7_APOLU|nr:hypothetical protein GE061_004791 [Apolygus lucorum]
MKGLQVVLAFAIVGLAAARSTNSRINQSLPVGNEISAMHDVKNQANAAYSQKIADNTRAKKFEVYKNKLSWVAALEKCKERHTDLATIRSQEENDNLVYMIKKTLPEYTSWGWGNAVWIGGTRNNSEKGYYWMTDGVSVENFYDNWRSGDPKSNGDHSCMDYVVPTGDAFFWYESICDGEFHYACEYY